MVDSNLSRRRFLKLSATGAIVVVVAGVGAYLATQPAAPAPAATPKPTSAAPPAPVVTPAPRPAPAPAATPIPIAPTPTLAPTPSPREKMIADAKKEGAVSWYTSMDEETQRAQVNTFMKKYPEIKAEVVRADGAKLVQRYLSEHRANKNIMDIFQGSADYVLPALEAEIVDAYKSPEAEVFLPEQRDSANKWIAVTYAPQAIGYNVERVKGADIPETFWDLLKPRFKDKLCVYSPTGAAHSLLISRKKIIGEARWPEFVKGLSAQNPKVIVGTGQMIAMLKVGEVEVALWGYTGSITNAMKEGAPIDYVRKKKTMLTKPSLMWLNKYAPHPNAARLLYDHVISERGQTLLADTAAYIAARPGTKQKMGLGIGTGEPVTLDMVEMIWPFTEKDLEAEIALWNTLFGR